MAKGMSLALLCETEDASQRTEVDNQQNVLSSARRLGLERVASGIGGRRTHEEWALTSVFIPQFLASDDLTPQL